MSIRGGRGPRDDLPTAGEPLRRAEGYRRTGRYGRGPGDQRRYEGWGDRGPGALGLLRFGVFVAVMATVVLVGLTTVARPVVRLVVVPWADGNPGALQIGFVADLVREDLGPLLTEPAGSDASTVEFTVEPGDTPVTLAPRLLEAGVIVSERAFLFEAQVRELRPRLVAGQFLVARNLTPGEVVEALVTSRIIVRTLDVTFREGLRIEQIVAKLATVEGTRVEPAEFLALVRQPTAGLLADFPWLQDETVRPKGATLEGFLYPATYTLRVDEVAPSTAEDLVRMMLATFVDRIGEERLAVDEGRGLTFHQVLTLASIVEREAVLDEERARIAGVYQNRIDRKPSVKHGLLQADPTVIYAVDTVRLGDYAEAWTQYVFWTIPDGPLAEQELPEPLVGWNSYVVRGLPPGPIASPSLASIEAALAPDTASGFTYFVAIPGGKGAHDFSTSLAEHQRKLAQYGY